MSDFHSREPSLEEYWRGIILFGRNVASYKFALAKTLLELKPASGQLLKLSDIAPVFARNIVEHIKHSPKQTTSPSSSYLKICDSFSKNQIDHQSLVESTVRLGFNNVIGAFHVVGSGEIGKKFYLDERSFNGGIRITDEFSMLLNNEQISNLILEAEARWRLVETAWELNLSSNLIAVNHDSSTNELFTLDSTKRRKSVTSSRHALNGYQKGKCFYCDAAIFIDNNLNADVDHFFPHKLKFVPEIGSVVDGIWNLVLSCIDCNRGVDGKFDKLPSLTLLIKLSHRNEYLIKSHHPLRETLINQTGRVESDRKDFLNKIYQKSLGVSFHTWEPKP
jgi:hypothetical protein